MPLTIELAVPESRPGKRATHTDGADDEAKVLQNVRPRRGSTVAELYGRILDSARRQVRGASSVDFSSIEEGLRDESLTSADAFVRALQRLGHDAALSEALVAAAISAGSAGQPLGDGLAALQARRPKLGRVVLSFESAETPVEKQHRSEKSPAHEQNTTSVHQEVDAPRLKETMALSTTTKESCTPNTDLVRIHVITV